MLPIKDDIPNERFPLVTLALIVANVLVYFLVERGGIFSGASDASVIDYGAVPYAVTHCPFSGDGCASGVPSDTPTAATLVTSMFMHADILHLGGNMLFLWIFGANVEDRMNRALFVVFYLAGGLVALFGQVVVEPGSAAPTVGASGAVAAVLGGYLLLFPRAKIVTVIFIVLFFGVVELPAILVLGFWFVMQLAFGLGDIGSEGGVAYFAHIGGFVFGLAMVRAFVDRRPRPPPSSPPRAPTRRMPAF